MADDPLGTRSFFFVQRREVDCYVLHRDVPGEQDGNDGPQADIWKVPADGIAIDGIDFREPTAMLRLKAIEKSSGEPMVAKISLKRAGGKFHAPVGALYRVTNRVLHFYCRNEIELTLPAGKYELIGTRGLELEYRASGSEFELRPGQSFTRTISMEHWTDMAASG